MLSPRLRLSFPPRQSSLQLTSNLSLHSISCSSKVIPGTVLIWKQTLWSCPGCNLSHIVEVHVDVYYSFRGEGGHKSAFHEMGILYDQAIYSCSTRLCLNQMSEKSRLLIAYSNVRILGLTSVLTSYTTKRSCLPQTSKYSSRNDSIR